MSKMPFTVETITSEMLKCINGDGHSLYKPAYYIDAGWPKEFIDSMTHDHESDTSDHKSTIFVDGKAVAKLESCVASFDFHASVCHVLKLNARSAYGRGTQAGHYANAIWSAVKASQHS